MAEEVSKSNICGILRRFQDNTPAFRQPGSGGSNVKFTGIKNTTLKRLFDYKDGILQ